MGERSYRGQAQKTQLDRLLQGFAQTRVGGFLFITVFPAIDKRVMPLTRGKLRIGARQPVLLLHARGAKSGQERVTPLLYTPRGEDFVLVASKAGADHNPAWYHNLKANPTVTIELGKEKFQAKAIITKDPERQRLFDAQAKVMPTFNDYQKATTRQIPVIALERM